MSAAAQTALLTRAGEAFVQAIETAGTSPLTPREHLDLLDEITDWLARAQMAHDVVWNRFYDGADERMSEGRPSSSNGKGGSHA